MGAVLPIHNASHKGSIGRQLLKKTPMNRSSLHLELAVCTGVVSVRGLAITGTTVIGPEYLTSYMYLAILILMQMACSCLLESNEIYEGEKWQKLFCTTFPGS